MRRPLRPVLVLLWIAALTAVAWVQLVRIADPTYPGMPWQDPHQLGDFRDAVWLPGRFLLNGGNPYDVTTYLQAHPWAQEFNLYAPVWLVLAVALAILPFLAAAWVYLALGVVLAGVFLRVTLVHAAPALVVAGVPVGLLWFALWSPSRYALQNGGTFVVFVGSVLAMLAVADGAARTAARVEAAPPGVARAAALSTWTGAAGLALALVKPQFGLPLAVLAVAVRRWDVVWRAVLMIAAASLPTTVWCVVTAGGIGPFLESVRQNLAYSSSPDSPTGLASAFNGRIDLLGLAARLGAVDQPGWLGAAVPVALLVWGAWLLRRSGDRLVSTTVAGVVTLLGLVHQPYDTVLLVLPVALVAAEVVAGLRARRWPAARRLALWLAASLPVAHLHAGTLLVAPGIGRTGADLIDVVAMLAALVLVTAAGPSRSLPAAAQDSSGADAAR